MSKRLSTDEDARLIRLVRTAETKDMIPSAVRRLMDRKTKSKQDSGHRR